MAVEKLMTLAFFISAASLTHAQTFEGPLHTDWRCTSMPNSLYKPGVVYKSEGTGSPTFVADLSEKGLAGFEIRSESAKLGRVTQGRTAGGMVKAGLLERVFKAAKGSLGFEVEQRENYDVEYDLVAWKLLSEESISVASEWIRRNAVDKRPSVRYWLIREGLEASKVSYKISTGLVGNIGGEVEAMKKLSAKVVAGGGNSKHYVLERALSPALWVCQIAQRMTPESNLVGETTWKVDPRVPLDLPEVEAKP